MPFFAFILTLSSTTCVVCLGKGICMTTLETLAALTAFRQITYTPRISSKLISKQGDQRKITGG